MRRPSLHLPGGLSLFATLVLLSGCAKTGEPQPPAIRVPRAAADLRAIQYADTVVLSVAMPTQNTNGSPVTSLRTIEVFRVVEGRGGLARSWSDAELEQRGERVLSVDSDRFSDYGNQSTFTYHDEKPVAEGRRLFASGLTYAVRFINERNQTAGFGNRAYIEPVPIPGAPAGLAFELSPDRIRLRWNPATSNLDGSKPPRVAGYNIYRSQDPKAFPPAPLNAQPVADAVFEDSGFQFDQTYYFAVSAVGSLKDPYAEGRPSPPLRVDARDTFPPGMPGNLDAVLEGTVVVLLWTPPPEADVAGYRVHRTEEGSSVRTPCHEGNIATLSFRDENAPRGKKLSYFVTAVDRHSNEGPAAEVTVEVP